MQSDKINLLVTLSPIQVDRAIFENAPISKQYPQEMYYRLLAPLLLPESLEKVLYIDPDILVINPVRPLWKIDLNENTFAAASHTGVFDGLGESSKIGQAGGDFQLCSETFGRAAAP